MTFTRQSRAEDISPKGGRDDKRRHNKHEEEKGRMEEMKGNDSEKEKRGDKRKRKDGKGKRKRMKGRQISQVKMVKRGKGT